MSNVIDWSKYGRGKKRQQPEIQLEYRRDGDRIVCTATFPIDRLDDLKSMIDRQIEYWEKN
ncbi:hypothetical protein [Burkholderia glumae]|uniref:hypothetical protein n=1 Tax=Burkholderia glumae TaxID=337 RepID=UPI0021514500|nr:hypothetical protein [Burkholderia glumae]